MGFLRLDGRPDALAADVDAVRRWLEHPDPERVLVETSGSTGRPKRVVLTRQAVLASAVAAQERLGGPGRWVLALSPAYVAGLQVVVRALLAGHEPLPAAGVAPQPGGRLYTSLVPTQLLRLLDTDPGRARAYDAILVGGGPLDPALRRRAAEAGVAVTATYGASETAGGCVYDGLPLSGVEVRVGDDTRVALRGPVLFEGYDGDPRLTREVLVDGWFLTEDLGEVGADGRLRILGRRDDVVVSGGVNVPTPAVAARLREHPAVRDVAVVGVDDPEWGQRVVAFVVGPLSLEQARDWVGEVHPRTWAPRQLRVVPELPLLPTGKVDRVRLRAW